jgi:hypothetical protein
MRIQGERAPNTVARIARDRRERQKQDGMATGECPQRLAEIRARVLSGAYDAPAILGSIATKIIERRDV